MSDFGYMLLTQLQEKRRKDMPKSYCQRFVHDIMKKYDNDHNGVLMVKMLKNQCSRHNPASIRNFNEKYMKIIQEILQKNRPSGYIDKLQLFEQCKHNKIQQKIQRIGYERVNQVKLMKAQNKKIVLDYGFDFFQFILCMQYCSLHQQKFTIIKTYLILLSEVYRSKRMHSVLNHDEDRNKSIVYPKDGKQDIGILPQSKNFNQFQGSPISKVSIKQLYKNQLDTFMQQKQKQKKKQKEIMAREKQQYNQRMKLSQQNQKIKDLAYKNYYKMLLDSQEEKKEFYVSPYEVRDRLKDSYIQHSIQQQKNRFKNVELQLRKRQAERKNQYKQELNRQLEQRRKAQEMKKNYRQQEKNYYRQMTPSPQQIEAYEKERKKQQMQHYRQDLDFLMQDKLNQSRRNHIPSYEPRVVISQNQHNPLINPIPYNIQNPYILKQMQKMSASSIRNQFEFGNSQGNSEFQNKNRNQSSYFAKKGNILIS